MVDPEHNSKASDDKAPESKSNGHPFLPVKRFLSKSKSLAQYLEKVIPGQPEQEKEKNPVSSDHLGLFGSGKHRTKSDSQRGGGDIVSQQIQKADQQGPHDEKKPERKGDLFGGEKCKSDKGRVKIDLEFLKAGKKAGLREIRAGEDQGRDLGDRGKIEVEAVYRLEKYGEHETCKQVAVGQQGAHFPCLHRLPQDLRDL